MTLSSASARMGALAGAIATSVVLSLPHHRLTQLRAVIIRSNCRSPSKPKRLSFVV